MTQETKLTIAGLHVQVGDSLRSHCADKIEELKEGHFEQIPSVDISFRQERHKHLSEMRAHAGEIELRVVGEGVDFYAAFDDAVKTLTRRLEKYKGRLHKHRNRRAKLKEMASIPVMKLTHRQVEEASLEDAPEDMFAEYMPKIVHQDVRNIQTMSVDDAVMQMDLLHTNFFIFHNAKTGGVNLVYRDSEGSPVGWVELDQVEKTEAVAA